MGLFYVLRFVVLSIDFLLDSSQVIGWAVLAAVFHHPDVFHSSSIFSQNCLNVVQQTIKKLPHAFPSAIEHCVVSMHVSYSIGEHYLLYN